MAIFNRRPKPSREASHDETGSSDVKKEKSGRKRPANTAFKQQRLKAWQPILTPKTVLPLLFAIGIVFAPIGGILLLGSSKVNEITLDYTDCDTLSSGSETNLPSFKYSLRSGDGDLPITPPTYRFVTNSSGSPGQQNQCIISFDVPKDLPHTVLLYYKLTNFYQNHRRYVKSLNTDQLKGKGVTLNDLKNSDCKPVAVVNESLPTQKAIYPCGLIANSFFNDTFSNLTQLGASTTYVWSEKGIAWPGEQKKYATTPGYNLPDIVPPPNWMERFPNGYNQDNIPDLRHDEHFHNWMRTAGLPTFWKLWGRNDNDVLTKGRYNITVNMNFPVKPYKGTKSVVISTVSWMGGKNPFLGWAYVGAAALFIVLGIAGTIRHIVKPRRLGDMSLLSWNQPTR